MRRPLQIVTILLLCIGCKSLLIDQEFHIKTEQSILLGSIGEHKQLLLENDYNHTALPVYFKPIRLQVKKQDFNNASLEAYTNALASSNKGSMGDSLAQNNTYLKLEISDRVVVINALNSKDNGDVKQYLELKKDSHLVTSISIAFDKVQTSALLEAEEIYLTHTGIKNYSLSLFNSGELRSELQFKDGIVFAYQASQFCWKENDHYQLEIVDLVEDSDHCPNKTYKSSSNAKKNIDYYKF